MKKIDIDKEVLYRMYVIEKMNSDNVAKALKCSKDTILTKLKEYNIPVRNSGRQSPNLAGKVINDVEVLYRKKTSESKSSVWICKCHCGKLMESTSSNLLRGVYGCWDCRNELISITKRGGYEEISGEFWNRTKKSAEIRNIKFDINIKEVWELFLKQDRKCALSGIELKFNMRRKEDIKNCTASLDRIDSFKDYTIDNVQWVHKNVNRMKWDLTQEEFINICKKVVNYESNRKS